MLNADVLVFAAPVYALRTTAAMKNLLDHLCAHWMVHRPDSRMFQKCAVILTNSIGAPNAAAQKDVRTSLNWLGVSSVWRLGFGLMEGAVWEALSEKRRLKIEAKTRRMALACASCGPAKRSLKVRVYFEIARFMHAMILKGEDTPSADNRHWLDKGWIRQSKRRKPR